MSRVVLIEATPRTPAAATRAVRLACGGERGYTHFGFTDWRAGVLDEPLFTAAFGFDESGFTGGAVPQAAAIGFSSAIPGLVDDLAGLVWADAPVTVRALDEATGAVETRLVGAAAAGSAEAGRLTVTLSDLSRELTRPVIAGRFAGSGGLEGGSDATGRVKRRSLGAVFDVEGRLLDKAFNIHEFGDPARPLRQFVAVRDKGRDGPLVELGWQGSAPATLQALRAAAVPAGGGIGAPSIACLRWWTQASGPLCADLLGETAGGYVETAGAIAARLVAGGSTLAVDAAAAIAARPARAGLHVDGESETFGQALDRLLLPVSLLWKLDATGMVRILPVAFDAPVERLTSLRSARRAVYRPARRVIVGYQRNHRTHGDGEIAAAVDDAATAALAAAGAAADQASAASAELAIIGSDGWLSRGEKAAVVREWTAIDQEIGQLNLRAQQSGFDGSRPERGGGDEAIYNLNSAKAALDVYLSGLSPLWSDARYDTAINPSTFQGRWTDYYFAKIQLLTAMDAAAAMTADWNGVYGTGKDQLVAQAARAAADASAAVRELDVIASDSFLSAGEKPAIIRQWKAIADEAVPLANQAAQLGISASQTNAAREALAAYLNSLSPRWDDTSQDTAIVAATFEGRWTDYYHARTLLLNAMADAAAKTAAWDGVYGTGKDQLVAQAARAAADASAAVRELNVIASDSFLSAGEKPAIIRDWQAIADEAVPLANQAAQLGVSAAQVGAARDALAAYLNSLSPGWADTSQDTAIVAATFAGRWTDYYYARALLLNAMADAAAKTAAWDGVYGTGKDQLVAQAARAAADASAAVRELNVIASDSFLSAGEKPAVIRDWQAIANEAVPLANQAAQLGVSAAQVGAARDALAAYLNSLSPGWADTSQDTAIVAATFAGRWTDYYYARALLLNAMAQAAAQAVPATNRIKLSLFERDTIGWVVRYDPGGIAKQFAAGTSGGLRFVQGAFAATAAGQVASIGTGLGYDFAVSAGEYLWVRCGVQACVAADSGPLQSAALVLRFVRADGSSPDTVTIWSGAQAGAFAQVSCAAPIPVPAGAVRAALELYGTSAGAVPFLLALTQPMASACSRAQTASLPFVAGPNALDGADVTSQNTAGDTAKVAGVSAADLTNLVASTTATANAVQSFTADVADNNRASPDEKKRYAGAVAGWDADVAAEVQRASAAGLGAEGAAYQAAYAAFRGFLVDTVRINDLSTRTYFDRGRFVALSSAFTAAATALANAIKSRVQLLNAAGRATTATVNATSVVAGIKTLNLTGFALSQAKSGSTVTVAATASRYRLDTGVVIDYPSASFPGLAFSTAYYVWRDDPDLDGGSGYGISTDLQDASAPGRIYLGYIVTMSSAGTGGSGGGGGTSNCVDPEMWVEIEGEGAVRAGDVVEGQRILCLNEDWAGTEYVEVTGSARYDNIKARIATASGEVWDGAINTPVPRRAGDYVAAGNAAGAEVPVGGAGEVAWSVAAVTPIGVGPVQRISCRERVFGAGRDPGRLVFTHNAAQKP